MDRSSRRGSPALRLEALETRDTPTAVGALDPGFGTGGRVVLPGVPFADMALQPDGKVVAIGSLGGDFLVARFNSDGTPDTSFDADGQRQVDMGGTADQAIAVTIQPDGKIVVVGTNGPNAGGTDGGDFAVLRLNPDGSTDSAFNGGGQRIVNFGGTDAANAVALDSQNRIVVAGVGGAAPSDFAAIRLNPADGSLDTTFGPLADGKATVDFGGTPDAASAVAIQADDRILLAGTNGVDFALARLNADGKIDTTFDGDGKRTLNPGGGADAAGDLLLQPDGRIVVAGVNGADMTLYRLLPTDGSSDNTFGTAGKATVDISGVDDARRVALQADGKLVVVGDTGTPDLAVVRLSAAGVPDASFGTNGVTLLDSGGNDFGMAVAVTPTGRIVVAGQLGTDGVILRLVGRIETGPTIVVSGGTPGQALVYTPNPATGQYNTNPTAVIAPFPGSVGILRTAVADVNGDGVHDTVLVTGPGSPIQVAVVSGIDNNTLLVKPFDPFGGNFTGGGFVTAADLDGDGRAEFIVSPDQGGGPRVTVFSLGSGSDAVVRSNFLGIDDPNFRGGARTAAGDVNGDGVPDLAVAAGFLGGPRVALFSGATLFGTPTRLLNDFYAFPGSDSTSLRNGAFVAAGDVDGDGFADLIFGGGPGGAPRVFVLNGRLLSAGDIQATYNSSIANFFVGGNQSDRGGVRVAVIDADGDSKLDFVVGSGEKVKSSIRVYLSKNITNGSEPTGSQIIDPYGQVLADGVFVG